MPFKISHRAYFWLRIFAVAFAIAMIVQIVRVNSKPDPVSSGQPLQVKFDTAGELVKGRVDVPAGEFLSFPIRLNKRTVLKGNFRTVGLKGQVQCLVLDSGGFETWRAGGETKPALKTGYIPGGNVHSVLPPGDHFLVIDNRQGTGSATAVDVSFELE